MIREFFRFYTIFYRFRLDQVFRSIESRTLKLLHWFTPLHLFIKRIDIDTSRGKRLRFALLELGTIYVKLGQALSVRVDLIAPDICEELALLRDDCPAFSFLESKKNIESEMGLTLSEVFSQFDKEPIAAASIAQVHGATLHTGESVVVKVVRPDIDERIEHSAKSMLTIAGFIDRWSLVPKRLKPIEVVSEFIATLHREKDMLREGSNANLIKHNFKNDARLHVPKIYWEWSHTKVLVMERIEGIPIHQTQKLIEANINLKQVAENGVQIFFKQVFEHNLFHADMHPGNVFIDSDGVYKAVDFGIVGSLSNEDQMYMAENLLAFLNRDYRRIADLHIQSGWVKKGTRAVDLEAAVRSVSEPVFGKPIGELSIGQLLIQLLKISSDFGMEVQPQLILLQKTLFNIEGLGRRLYPQLDLWETAKPFLESWVRREFSPKALLKEFKKQVPYIRYQLPQLLEGLHTNINSFEKSNGVSWLIRRYAIATILILIGTFTLFLTYAFMISMIVDVLWISIGFICLGLWLLFKR